jgi:hypothetical protein
MKRFVVVGLLVAAGCAPGKTAAQIIAGAPAAAAARGTAKVSLESVVRLSGQGQSFSTTTRGDGVSELGATRRGHMTLTITTSPSAGKALAPCEMVSQGTLAYLKVPPAQRGPSGKSWVRVDIAKVAGIDPSAFSSDPSAQLDYLNGVSGTVRKLGKDDIRGVSATHYQYTLKVDQFLAKVPANTRAQMQSAMKSLGISSFPVDTWIDGDGLPRRLAFDWKTTKQGASLDISTRVDTYDYGTDASVTAPSASDVVTATNPATAFAECFGAPAGSLGGVPQS